MCGISGCISYNSTFSEKNINDFLGKSSQSMFARGPDSSGQWMNDGRNVGFAHRRLSIIETSDLGSQPMKDLQTGNTIVYNGEIYNFYSLKQKLLSKGIKFKSNSDTEVLLKLYEVYDEKMLPMLRGMFSFAIWDHAKQEIFLARDHFGIKPLYYYEDENKFQFASQVKAILAGKSCRLEIEPAGLVGFYLWGHIPEPFTLYKNIYALAPGSYLKIKRDGSKKESYFFKIYEEALNVIEQENFSDHSEIIIDSINSHLTSDVPVGIFLSAGIDSSIIANTANQIFQESKHQDMQEKSWLSEIKKLTTLTLGFKEYEGTIDDEVPLAQEISQSIGSNQVIGRISKDDFTKFSNHIFTSMDQPSIDGINTYFVSKLASDNNLKVTLSGLGADEFFGGYSTFTRIPKILKTIGPINDYPFVKKGLTFISNKILRKITSPKFSSILEYSGDLESAYLLNRSLYMPWELPTFLDSGLVKEGWNKLQTINQLKSYTHGINDDFLKISLLETSFYMKNQLLRDSDWASMAHSLELRVPFVDIEVFKHICRLRSHGKIINKSQLFKSLGHNLPSIIGTRSKTGFSTPVSSWSNDFLSRPQKESSNPSKLWAHEVIKYFPI